MPILSTAEHIRYGLALYLSMIAANALTFVFFGAGWTSIVIWVASVIVIALALKEGVRYWGRRQGRHLIASAEWNKARGIAQQSWQLTAAYGFLWGFAVTGVAMTDWIGRLIAGLIGTISYFAISAVIRSKK